MKVMTLESRFWIIISLLVGLDWMKGLSCVSLCHLQNACTFFKFQPPLISKVTNHSLYLILKWTTCVSFHIEFSKLQLAPSRSARHAMSVYSPCSQKVDLYFSVGFGIVHYKYWGCLSIFCKSCSLRFWAICSATSSTSLCKFFLDRPHSASGFVG